MSLSIPFLPPVSVDGESLHSYMPVVYFDDFVTSGYEAASANKFSRAADTSDWLLTQVGTATHAMTDDGVSAIKVGTGSTDNNTTNCQVNGEAFALASGKTLIWEMRCHIEDVTLTDWFVGVAISTTDILTACSDYIGFGNTANAASILAINGKDDTAEIADADSAGQTLTDTGSDLVNGTYVVLRFEVEGTSAVRFYVDGVLKATHTTDLPDNEAMSPAFAVRCASGAAEAITVDYVLAIIDR